jgi:hypothetical protein
MSGKKFDEFYFENDKNYPDSIYWNSFDLDRKATEDKYDNHMFCPLCHLAPLTPAKGEKRRYFKVSEANMYKHDLNCSYKLDSANKTETKEFYDDLDSADIRNRLISCMNRMLKKNVRKTGVAVGEKGSKIRKDIEFFNFTTKKQKRRYLPHKSLLTKFNEDDLKIQKVFYGECDISLKTYNVQGEIKRYYLKIMQVGGKYNICDISITPYVYHYLEDVLKDIPEDGKGIQRCYICFSGIMDIKTFGKKGGGIGYSYNCLLTDSRLIVIEKST